MRSVAARFFATLPVVRILSRFRRAEQGMVLVEFAMVLPIMALMYVGGVAVTQGVIANRQVTILSHSLGDLAAQSTYIAATDAAADFGAAAAILSPFSASATILRMRFSSVKITNKNHACVEWSYAPSGSAFVRAPGQNVDTVVPTAFRSAADTWLIMPEVEYDYTPIIGQGMTGTITMKQSFFLSPRRTASISADIQPAKSACPDT